MKKILLTAFLLIVPFIMVLAQRTSRDNYTGPWNSTASWENGNAPSAADPAVIGSADLDLEIYGYVTRDGNLSFVNVNAGASGPDFIVHDTLVVLGNITFANKAANLILGPDAVLIVFGNVTATNIITIENGGVFVVTGNMNFSPSGQDEFENQGGGELYVGGSVNGNGDAEGGEANWDNLADDYPIIHDFVMCGGEGSCMLPVTLSYLHASLDDQTVTLKWATASEKNFRKFIIQRSSTGVSFHDIGEVAGKGFDIRNVETTYSFDDLHPLTGYNYYRLKAVDLDDSYEYFGVKVVKVTAPKGLAVYPNPSTGESISFTPNFNPQESDRIILIDQMGSEVLNLAVAAGQNSISFENQLRPGVYMLRYVSKDFEKVTRVLVSK